MELLMDFTSYSICKLTCDCIFILICLFRLPCLFPLRTMQRNQISTIHAQAFTGATKIRSIRMDENSLGCSGLQDFLQLQIPVFERFSNLNAEKNQASTECVEELQHSALGTKVPRLLL
eukprot:m.58655 g.58655  ORF g.58655 m.58655 type:complete len:119 (+) comp11192_c0_seq1:84-440(+)